MFDVCQVTGTLYRPDGSLAVGERVYVRRVIKSGELVVMPQPYPGAVSDALGQVNLTLPQGSRVLVDSEAEGLNTPGGVELTVPPTPTADLGAMLDLPAFPEEGLVVRSQGVALAGRVASLDFSSSFSVTQPTGGAALVDLNPATSNRLGAVKVGGGLSVAGDGTLATDVRSVAGRTGAIELSSVDISDFALAVGALLPANLVNTFNTRTGAVVLESGDVTAALGFTPENAATSHVNTFNTRTGAVTLQKSDVTTVLGFDPLGRAGGQTPYGGTASGESLTLNSTSHATKGKILLGASSAYDGANVRLGINTTSPNYQLELSGGGAALGAISTGTPAVYAQFQNQNGQLIFGIDSSGGGSAMGGSTGNAAVFGTQNAKSVHLGTGNTARLTIDSAGLVGINKSSSIGAQLHVVAGAAGTKGLIVQMAASPSANPFELQDSTGAAKLSVSPAGDVTSVSVTTTGMGFVTAGSKGRFYTGGLDLASDNVLGFLAGFTYGTTRDASLTRASGGVLQIGDGGANANGYLKAARFQFSTTLTPTSSADAQGGTGDVRYDDNYIYIKTASGGWKRAALTAF